MPITDYVLDSKIENGSVFDGLTLRVVGNDVLFDFAATNPEAVKRIDPTNKVGIQPNEILIDPNKLDKETVNHECNEYELLKANPEMSYWEGHTTIMKLSGKTTENLSTEATVMKTEMIRKSLPITIRKNAEGQQEILITTPNYDRGCDRVFPEGGDLVNYLKNPVIMWIHDYKGSTPSAGLPIAKNSYLKVTPEGIIAGPPLFLEGDEFASRVKNAWDKGFLNTASIGFNPIEYETNEKGGTDYKKWEMLEWSFAPIPMNAEAARIAKSNGLAELVEEIQNATIVDLTEKKPKQYTQEILADIIDELKCAVTNVGLSKENEIELRRLTGSDIPDNSIYGEKMADLLKNHFAHADPQQQLIKRILGK